LELSVSYPADISALAHDYKPTAKSDGWSFIMYTYPSGKENKHRPRVAIVSKDSHTTFMRLVGGCPRHNGKPAPCTQTPDPRLGVQKLQCSWKIRP
jgi:hypothetical protein